MENIMTKLDVVKDLTANCYIRNAEPVDYADIADSLRKRMEDTKQEMVQEMLNKLQVLEDSI